ncbi:MAG: PorT family protein [Cytophagales bacterium]|jgi:hypothetical protein|nr:PorT family protein [Cytophagales bacterium]
MRKTLLTVSACICINLLAKAQFIITPKLGVTVSTMSLSDNVAFGDVKSKAGLALGAAFELPLTDALSIQPELLFVQKGWRETSSSAEIRLGLNYLEIPVLAKYRFGEADELHFFGYAGPYFGFGLGGRYRFSGGGSSESATVRFGDEPDNYSGNDLYLGGSDEVSRMDAGLNIGAGVGLPLGPGVATFEARYGLGLVNLNKPGQGQSRSDVLSQHRVFGIFVGYSLSLGN